MSDQSVHIARIIVKHFREELSEIERLQLEEWLAQSESNRAFLARFEDREFVATELKMLYAYDEQEMLEKVMSHRTPVKRIPIWKRFRWVAAASVTLLLALGVYQFLLKPSKSNLATEEVVAKEIVAPASNRATITLDNGQTIYLDSAANGRLAVINKTKLVKLANGQIAYQSESGAIETELRYNTLSNPIGSKPIDMALSDGSHVWLNAGSSVTYPVAFVDNERNVSMTGEAYFEVAKDTRAFNVKKNEVTVQVLGTHFNVNAYDNEASVKVTLLEGSVKVNNSISNVTIKPGEQAEVTSAIKLNKNVDLDAVMAWKRGVFDLEGLGLEAVMRQMERWYDIDVVYESKVPRVELGGKMTMDVTLKGLLVGLEKLGLRYRLEGRKLVILP